MTLGSLWRLLERETKWWMLGGAAAVLAGVTIGFAPTLGIVDGGSAGAGFAYARLPGDESRERLLPSLFLSLGGGYAALFPGLRAGGDVHLLRDWKVLPLCGRLLWAFALATATAGLMACGLAAAAHSEVPVALVWLFMGPFLALSGWAAALMGTAAAVRSTTTAGAHAALATQSC
jgi:hypothetical protein